MKKPANVDIRNLFKKFGGDTGNYQEIQQDYVDENAQQSWPIIKAMEKERAVAPTLKASAATNGYRTPATPASKPGPFVTKPAAPVAKRAASAAKSEPSVTPVAVHDHEAAGEKKGSLSAILSKPAPAPSVPAASTHTLFDALNLTAKPAATDTPPAPAEIQPAPAHRLRANDPLNTVFSRLLNPQRPDVASSPENNFRSILEHLKK